MLNRLPGTTATASVGSNSTLILTLPCNGSILSFDVTNSGGVALNTFALYAQSHPSGVSQLYLSGSDWTSTSILSMMKSGTNALGTLGSASASFAHVIVHANYSLSFYASVSGTVKTTLNIFPSFTDAE